MPALRITIQAEGKLRRSQTNLLLRPAYSGFYLVRSWKPPRTECINSSGQPHPPGLTVLRARKYFLISSLNLLFQLLPYTAQLCHPDNCSPPWWVLGICCWASLEPSLFFPRLKKSQSLSLSSRASTPATTKVRALHWACSGFPLPLLYLGAGGIFRLRCDN